MFERVFPFSAAPKRSPKTAIDVSKITPSKVFNVRVLGVDLNRAFSTYSLTLKERASFEAPTFDFDRIIQAIDTDSYVKQAFWKYKELFWKEGWEIIGENPEAVAYLWQRIDFMEEIMGRPFNDFLTEAIDQLCKMGNVFIVEARGKIQPYFPGSLNPPKGKDPISGYYLIPTETVQIARDQHNQPIRYKQSLNNVSSISGVSTDPEFSADEIIHFALDKKPGRAFGTPFVSAVLDDVIVLRQIEEDIQNLIHQELFPLYQYIVGTPEAPSSPEELEQAMSSLDNLRSNGGLIMPERHELKVLGASGKALDAQPYLVEMKVRLISGLGLSPHHLGMSDNGGGAQEADRLDIALYDKIKLIQKYVEGMVRLHIFNPLLREGGFDPAVNPIQDGSSDRCFMRFKEIDKDTQVKMETHIINKFNSNIIDLEEVRLQLGEDPEYNLEHMLMTLTAHIQTVSQMAVQQQGAALQPVTTKTATTSTGGKSSSTTKPPAGLPAIKKPDAQDPSTGILPNAKNVKKGSGNVIRPANQFGRRNSPNIRHMDDIMLTEMVNLIDDKDIIE